GAAADRVVAFVREREQAAPADSENSGAAGRTAGSPAASTGPQQIRVDLGPRSYDVWIGEGLLDQAASHLDRCGIRGRVALLTHPRIEALYGRALAGRLGEAGYEVVPIAVPPSESSKSLRMAGRI